MCKVSIIVPIYNVEKYIEKCVRSLLEQTFKDIEYIFVNDATPDNSIYVLQDIISEYPSRREDCIIVNHSKNKGVAAARNTGLNISRGEYVIYCDSDDWIDPRMIEEMYNCAIENKADIVSCDFRMVYGDRDVIFKSIDWMNDDVVDLKNYIASTWTILVTLLVKKDVYIKNKLSSQEGYSYCEDFNLSVKLVYCAQKKVHLDVPFYYYRQNVSSVLHNMNEKTMHDEQLMYIDVINYFKIKGVYEYYKKELCWRILKSKQEWVLNTGSYYKFLAFHPDSHKYIWSCPFINFKLKVMMWSLTHHMSFISRFMLLLRYLRHGKKN